MPSRGGPGYLASVASSNTYTLVTQGPAPTFNPAPGDYASPQSVTITTTLAGAQIYYTTDGTTPTTANTLYTGPVAITASEPLKAIATAQGVSNSAVAGGLYNIVANAESSLIPRAFRRTSIIKSPRGAVGYWRTVLRLRCKEAAPRS